MAHNQDGGFVAVTDRVEGIGSSVYWSLKTDQKRETLVAAWEAAGLDPKMVPGTRGDAPALWLACAAYVDLRNAGQATTGAPLLIARTVPTVKGDGKHVIAIVSEAWSDDTRTETRDATYSTGIRVMRHTDGVRDDLEILNATEEQATFIRNAYAAERDRLPHSTVGNWLANRVIPSLGGVNMKTAADGAKSSGGLYYLPPGAVEVWRTMVGALRAADAGRFYELPTMRSEQAVEAILDAFAAEVEKATAKLEDALIEDELGQKAIKTAGDTARAMVAKVAQYESILGRSLDGLRDQAERTVAAATAAALAVDAALDAAHAGA